MKSLLTVLIILLAILQFKLWFEDGGIADVYRLKKTVAIQDAKNKKLRERNLALEAEVKDLKQGHQAVEERARSELGMVKKGEEFYQIVPSM